MTQYKPGQKVKIISLEKVRSCLIVDGWREIGGPADPVEQEGEGQEELWREALGPDTELGEGCSLQHLLLRYTITRKTTPQ